ncbi:MAG: TolC family outer membrane protein [Pseudomonadota bacterium]
MKLSGIATSLLLLSSGALFATGVQAVDLKTAWQHSLQTDPAYLAAQEANAAGQEKAVQASALYKPKLSVTGYSNRIETESDVNLPVNVAGLMPSESSGSETGYKISFSQPLYRADNWATSKQLDQQAELATLQLRNAEQGQMLRVASAYFAVLLADQHVQLLHAQLAAITEQLADANARFTAGRAKITDVRDAEARHANVQASLIAAESEQLLRRSQFEALTGLAANDLQTLRADFIPTPPEPLSLASWQQRAQDGNLQVQQRQHQLVIAGADVSKTALASKPTLDLVASYSDSRSSGDLSPFVSPEQASNTVVGLQLTVPLYAGGSIRSQAREAEAKHREATQLLEAAKRDARLQVQDAYLAVNSGAARVQALKQATQASQTALDAALLGKQVGVKTTQDVLNAQQQLYISQFDLAQAQHGYLNGRLRLAAATGELSADDLDAINSVLIGQESTVSPVAYQAVSYRPTNQELP